MAKRRITKGKIRHISLCSLGANSFPVFYKDADQSVELSLLTKAADNFDEQGELLAVVYAPEIEDSQGDIASVEVIKDMMHGFARNGEGVDIYHDSDTLKKDQAFVAESFVIQKDDPRFMGFKTYDGKEVDVAGGWGIVMKIDDPELRTLYRSGEWNGVSMGGTGKVEMTKVGEDEADKIITALARRMNLSISAFGSLDMDAKELAELMKANNTALIEGIGTLLTTTLTKAGVVKTEPEGSPAPVAKADDNKAPEFSGPYTTEGIAKHALDLRLFKAQESVDWNSPESVKALQDEVAAIEKLRTESAAETKPVEKSDELKKAEAAVAKLTKASNQAPETDDGEESEDQRLFKCGQGMADHVNKLRGHTAAA